jgi:hypothetical protein
MRNKNKLYVQRLNQSINEDFQILLDFLIIVDVFQRILLENINTDIFIIHSNKSFNLDLNTILVRINLVNHHELIEIKMNHKKIPEYILPVSNNIIVLSMMDIH